MARYAIWDKKQDIYTINSHHTAAEYINRYAPWAANPNVKVIVGGGAINGMCFMEYEATVDCYKRQGAPIIDGMTDEEVLAAIEYFEDNPPVSTEVSAEERIAAALEYQVMASLPDEE